MHSTTAIKRVLHLFFLTATLLFSAMIPLRAQTMADATKVWIDEWKYAFSAEGRRAWKPEFTVRTYAGYFTGGPAITGGIRIDNKHTLGLMLLQGKTTVNASLGYPGHIQSVSVGLYKRRYFHLHKKDLFTLYSDLAIGAEIIYKVDGKYWDDPRTGEHVQYIKENSGDMIFAGTWQPGIQIRCWRNLHLFLGPTLATNTIGIHLGVAYCKI